MDKFKSGYLLGRLSCNGGMLEEYRTDLGLARKEVAKRLYITPQELWAWEHRKILAVSKFRKALEVLNDMRRGE